MYSERQEAASVEVRIQQVLCRNGAKELKGRPRRRPS